MAETTLPPFQLLKTKLQSTLQASYPHFTRDIHEWKAQEITALQEALHRKVKGYISEKWFYTHLKPTQNDKLPRIDMLDMLAQYVGYAGWQDFVFQTAPSPTPSVETNPLPALPTERREQKIQFLVYVAILILGGLVWYGSSFFVAKMDSIIEFCFQDADTQKPLVQDIDIFILQDKESPKLHKVNKNGCIQLKSEQKQIKLIVKAPYYKTDTLVRTIRQGQASELIKLKKDDYALLIHLIAKHGTTEAEKKQRQKQLDLIMDEEAQIFQIDESGLGVELYNKQEFIDKLALPISSLKNLQIIETQYQKGKIILLRFLQP